MKENENNLHNVNQIPEINKRFLEIINENKLTGYALGKAQTGITSSKITHIKKGRNKPTDEMLESLLKIVPALNRVYLYTGEGPKYDESKLQGENFSNEIITDDIIVPVDNDLHELISEIKHLRDELEQQKKNSEGQTKAILDFIKKERIAISDLILNLQESFEPKKENKKSS